VEVLPELTAYKRLLLETAKEIWRREHPQRIRLPRGFETDITLKFFQLQPGSTAVPLLRESSPQLLPLMIDHEVDEAAALLEDAIHAAELREAAPSKLPRRVIPIFEELGSTLRPDEFLLISAGTRSEMARYDAAVKRHILSWASSALTDEA